MVKASSHQPAGLNENSPMNDANKRAMATTPRIQRLREKTRTTDSVVAENPETAIRA